MSSVSAAEERLATSAKANAITVLFIGAGSYNRWCQVCCWLFSSRSSEILLAEENSQQQTWHHHDFRVTISAISSSRSTRISQSAKYDRSSPIATVYFGFIVERTVWIALTMTPPGRTSRLASAKSGRHR